MTGNEGLLDIDRFIKQTIIGHGTVTESLSRVVLDIEWVSVLRCGPHEVEVGFRSDDSFTESINAENPVGLDKALPKFARGF